MTIFQMAVRAYEAYTSPLATDVPSWPDLPVAEQLKWMKAIEAVTRPAPASPTESVNEALNRRNA
jgi:hypothetical protein